MAPDGSSEVNSAEHEDAQTLGAVVGGVKALLLSQMSSRLLTFFLNLAVARLLTPEEYGMVSIQFHLINTTILMLSREGFRRGCLVAAGTTNPSDSATHRPSAKPRSIPEAAIMPVAVLVIPCGVLVTVAVAFATVALSTQQMPQLTTLVAIQSLAAFAEILGEPLYIVAQARMMFRLRVAVEGSAQVLKAVLTVALLALLGGQSAGVAVSVAQLLYGASTTAGYAWAFRAELVPMARAAGAWTATPPSSAGGQQADRGHLVRMCAGFSLQAVEKLVLAEGSKLVMAAVENSYHQGVYGMVSNLGSLVVRLLFQPLEEGAFTAFAAGSKSLRSAVARGGSDAGGSAAAARAAAVRLAAVAHGMMKAAALVGLIIAAFGPAYSYTALRLVYGRRWSDTEAPTALGAYATYVALLAINGISEAFTHAVGDERQLSMANLALVVFGVTHMVLSFVLCQVGGTLGLIAADAIGMVLRISYSMWFMGRVFREYPQVRIWQWVPHPLALSALGSSAVLGLLSKHWVVGLHTEGGYMLRAVLHVAAGGCLLLGCLAVIYKTDGAQLMATLRSRKAAGKSA